MKILPALAAALLLVSGASASNCYPSTTYYPQYAPYVKTVIKEVAKVVPYYQKFVAVAPLVELPTYSAVYVNPVIPAPAPAPAPAAPMPEKSDTQKILVLLEGMNSKVDMIANRQNDQERRLLEVERIIRGSPPSSAPLPPQNGTTQTLPPQQAPGVAPPAALPQKNGGEPQVGADVATQALTLYKKSCAVCHSADKSADLGGAFTLIQADGSKAKLSAKQKARMVSYSYQNKMPPPNNAHKIPELTNPEVGLIVADNPQ
jgi:hypothetical protein